MNSRTQIIHIDGPVGLIQLSVDFPEELKKQPDFQLRGMALLAHPHPLQGGSMDNKVIQTLARTFNQLAYISVRPNFRGVGTSAGTYDEGRGELDDLYYVSEWMKQSSAWKKDMPSASGDQWIDQVGNLPLMIGGFSFGSFVGSHLCNRLVELGKPAERLVLVGSAAGKWDLPEVPPDTLVILGELDETITLAQVFDWARPQELTVQVIPGADHFFHRKLHCIRHIILQQWLGQVRPN